MQKESIANSIW